MSSPFLAKRGQSKIIRNGKELSALAASSIFAIDIETHGKPVGDCAYFERHGICGIAISNMQGDAAYLIINDGRSYSGLDIDYVIEFLNRNWFKEGSVAVLHNCKFDLGFLLARGLDISKTRIVDTWILKSIRRKGVFVSNALKDVVKEQFGIDTESEEVIKNWLEMHNTMDYGDIPIDLIGPYACDDVRYTLAIFFNEGTPTEMEQVHHDIYVRNSLHLIGAESHGICVDLDLMPELMGGVRNSIKEIGDKVKAEMGAAEVDINDDQVILHYLHSRSMHPGPRDFYGEKQYVLDQDFLLSVKAPLARTYLDFARKRKFFDNFSGSGKLHGRLFKKGVNAGLHPNFLLSIFSQGGKVLSKKPDFADDLNLDDFTRGLFKPRKDKKLLSIKAQDLPCQILAWYCQDEEILAEIGKGPVSLCNAYSARNGLGPDANSVLLRRLFRGRGTGALEEWYRAVGIPGDAKRLRAVQSQFEASITGYNALIQKLNQSLLGSRILKDRESREIEIEASKGWKALTLMINSSVGVILSKYMDRFCSTLKEVGADFVFAHGPEFVFEAAGNNEQVVPVIAEISKTQFSEPVPKWILRTSTTRWPPMPVNAEDLAMSRIQ